MSYYSDDWLTILEGDCREAMATMEPESVHCVVTSPPYWGLRDYGTATWIGGDEGCDHVERMARQDYVRETPGGRGGSFAETPIGFRGACGKCGAIRQDSQLGLEPTPEAYVESMVAVFREVRRVLRSDGTVWLNLGDSYSGGGGFAPDAPSNQGDSQYVTNGGKSRLYKGRQPAAGLKPKDLVGIPWRVAFALQADGWYLRSDIIWAKPNPMPESVTDRPTKAHEYLFLLSKSPRYYYDADAVREPMAREWDPATNGGSWAHTERQPEGSKAGHHSGPYPVPNPAGRNLRSVWSIATQPYPGAHFATFPEKLVEPCILAGSREYGVILDPFAGSGTVGRVAARLSRRAVLIDLNADYLGQAMKRNQDIPLGLETAG